MKKVYTKPQIAFDSFELSQSIATCELISNAVRDKCGYELPDVPGFNLFTAAVQACDQYPEPDDYAKICYEVPVEDNNLFSS